MLDAILVQDAYKKFGKASHPLWRGKSATTETGKVLKVAVDHVSFSVHEAEIFGVLGPAGPARGTNPPPPRVCPPPAAPRRAVDWLRGNTGGGGGFSREPFGPSTPKIS